MISGCADVLECIKFCRGIAILMALQLSYLGFSDNAVMSDWAITIISNSSIAPRRLNGFPLVLAIRSSPINGVRSLSQHEASTAMQPLMLFFRNWSFLYAERATQEQCHRHR
jgi:hypothetical protein